MDLVELMFVDSIVDIFKLLQKWIFFTFAVFAFIAVSHKFVKDLGFGVIRDIVVIIVSSVLSFFEEEKFIGLFVLI
jgi:hypothetical protein